MVELRNILIIFTITAIITTVNAALECLNKEDPCLCQINENEKLDISTALGDVKELEDTTADVNEHNYTTYTYIGCRDSNYTLNHTLNKGVLFKSFYGCFPITNVTTNTTIITCNTTVTVLGKASQTKFSIDDGQYVITFVNGSDPKIQPALYLRCESNKQPAYLKVIDDTSQKLLLSSPGVCIQTEHPHGMSGGSVFLLTLFIIASIYFIGGAVLLYFIRGARGAEMIPNIEFWRNLPGLCKDGAIFLLSGCKPNFVTTAETYDRI